MYKYILFVTKFQVFLPGDEMEEGDELTYDRSAYEMYHAVSRH